MKREKLISMVESMLELMTVEQLGIVYYFVLGLIK